MNWEQYKDKPSTVLEGKTEDGTRLILLFAKDYKAAFGHDTNINCPKCFRKDYNKLINLKHGTMAIKSTKTKKFTLKPKYEGIRLTGTAIVLTEAKITDELCIQFCAEHPAGKNLFDNTPKNLNILIKAYKEDAEKKAEEAKEAALRAEKAKELKSRIKTAYDAAKEFDIDVMNGEEAKGLDSLEDEITQARTSAEEDAKKQAELMRKNLDEKANPKDIAPTSTLTPEQKKLVKKTKAVHKKAKSLGIEISNGKEDKSLEVLESEIKTKEGEGKS